MNANKLLELLESKKQRRSEKITHLGLEHQPIIYEITVAEKKLVNDRIEACKEDDDAIDAVVIETIIKSMCKWDQAGEVTIEHVEQFKAIYSASVITELFLCVSNFNYLGEKGIATAKKS